MGALRENNFVGWYRSFYQRILNQVTTGAIRGFLPYGGFAISFWLATLPFLLFLTGAVYAISPEKTLRLVAILQGSPHGIASVGAFLYAASLVGYHPIDKNDYLDAATPTAPEEWELLLSVLLFGVLPASYLAFSYFEEATVVLEITGFDPFTAAIAAFILALVPLDLWFRHRYSHPGVNPEITDYRMFTLFFIVTIGVYLAQVAFETDILLYASGVEAIFIAHLVWSAFIARRLRWTIYEDWAGFDIPTKLSAFSIPLIPFWGLIARVPFAFAVYATLAGSGLTIPVVVASLSPLASSLCYIFWRAIITGDLKKPPRGFLSSPGRETYENQRRANEQKLAELWQLREPVEEFNEFAAKHDLPTLDEPSAISFNKSDIRKRLNEIHKYEARSLSGDDFNEYLERREAILEEL